MEFQEVINSRHSVRSYERKKVPKDILKNLIKNGCKAPSACNRQPWNFYIVNSREKRDKVSKLLWETYQELSEQTLKKSSKVQKISNEFYHDLGGAQNIIFAYRKKETNEPEYILPTDTISIACAIENIVLSAVDIGLGTCIVGTFNADKVKVELGKILGVENNEELVTSLVIGYPAKDFDPLKREKKKIDEVLTFV
ncbi:MAG: nitroreductase family protein [Nanoarchaeota archaeon]